MTATFKTEDGQIHHYLKLPLGEEKEEELEDVFYWEPDALNEQGWRLQEDGSAVPGEPPGYRPDLDRGLLHVKVSCIAEVMREANLISIPEIEYLGTASYWCKSRGRYDQESIILALATVLAEDGTFWKKQGQGILAGKDPRPRCHCGKLAVIYGGPGHDYCSPEHDRRKTK